MKKGLLLALLFALLLTPRAFAADESVWEMAKSEQYGKKAGGMLGRGLVNVATCFVDIIVQTVHGTQDGPPFVGTLTGLGGGLGCTALRVTSGALDVVTFWVPGFNGIPVSKNYDNCLDMEEETSAGQTSSAVSAVASAPAADARQAESRHNANDYVKK